MFTFHTYNFLMLKFYICILYLSLLVALVYHTESRYTCILTNKGVNFNDNAI